jgi:hypothetical protein
MTTQTSVIARNPSICGLSANRPGVPPPLFAAIEIA